MGLFFHELEKEYTEKGTANWTSSLEAPKSPAIKGFFKQQKANGKIISIELMANDEFIFYEENGVVKSLELCLTVMQEHFSLCRNERVYEIKLKRKNLITVIFTSDLEVFASFYIHLAKFCILTTFEKHFRLAQLLGKGTFSKVYNGYNIFSKEEVALKIFSKEEINQIEDGYLIVANEITNLEKLRQYKLSPLIETYESTDSIIIVMQKAEAGNMLDYLQQHYDDYNEEFIRVMTFRVLESLQELHSAGFIHRDIKPENIFFKNNSAKSSIFIGDFGLTVKKTQCQCTPIGRICSGTMGFIAPQILHQNKYDQKCDLFSIGCLLYFLYKGQSLFCSKTPEQICSMTKDQRIIDRKVKALNNLSERSRDLMLKLLRIDPKERISAEQAMNHNYFTSLEHNKPMTGEEDRTLREYISVRINKFFN